MRRLLAALCGALLVLTGCGLVKEAGDVLPVRNWGPYQKAYDCWTRHEQIHRDLSLVLDAQATYRSPQFQEAYLRRWAEVYRLPKAESVRQLAEAREQAGRELRFVLVAQTGRREWNDFTKPDSIWKVFLQNERGERVPLTARRHLENRTEVEGFFDLGPWAEAYELSFELPEGGFNARELTLGVASVLGETQFSWDLEGAGR